MIDHHVLARFQSGEMSSHEVKELVNTLKVHVEGSMPIAGVINPATNQKFSIFEAAKNGMIRKGAAFELLEAQAACGKIIDVHAGRVVTLETVRPNQNSSRELDGFMKLLEARLCEIKAQEKHNEKQVIVAA